MSTTVVLASLYTAIALAAFAVARARRAALGAVDGPIAWVLVALFWPFLLAGTSSTPTRKGRYAERLGALRRSMEHALGDAAPGPLVKRPKGELEAALARLEEASARLAELDLAIAAASPSAKSRLETLRDRADAQLAERAALLEEVIAQLTVLRFADLSAKETASEERVRVEALLAQLDALVAL